MIAPSRTPRFRRHGRHAAEPRGSRGREQDAGLRQGTERPEASAEREGLNENVHTGGGDALVGEPPGAPVVRDARLQARDDLVETLDSGADVSLGGVERRRGADHHARRRDRKERYQNGFPGACDGQACEGTAEAEPRAQQRF
jgi:hypothetical protein